MPSLGRAGERPSRREPLAALLVAMVVTSPLLTHLWGPVALLLAAIPGTAVMNRVRARAEVRLRHERQAVDGPPGSP